MYSFDEKKHLHMLDGKALTGTTTVLGVIAKPALVPWAAKMTYEAALEAFKALAKEGRVTASIEDIEALLLIAKSAHAKKKDKAGDWGTELHAMVEQYAKGNVLVTPPRDTYMEMAFNHFKQWASDNKVEFLESEKNVYSTAMWVGGICDLVVKIDGQIWLADVKTGSGIYPEHFWQMASYEMCLNEMGLYSGVAGYIVLNLKKDGKFEEKRSVSNGDNQEAFKAALKLYRVQEKLKNNII